MGLGINAVVFCLLLTPCWSFLETEVSTEAVDQFISTLKSFLSHSKVLDVILVIRNSNGVTRPDLIITANFLKNLLDSHINTQLRLALITYNTNATIHFNNIHNDTQVSANYKCVLFDKISSSLDQPSSDGFTNTYNALKTAADIFSNAREASKKVVLLLTDSCHNLGAPPAAASHLLQSLSWQANSSHDEVVIFAIGIKQASIDELKSISTDLTHHAVVFDSYKLLDVQRRKLFIDQVEQNWARVRDDPSQDNDENGIDQDLSHDDAAPKKCGRELCGGVHATCVCGRDTGEYACTCDLGHERLASSCQPCQLGYYKGSLEALSCEKCPQNSTTLSTGSSLLSDCVPMPGFSKCPSAPVVANAISYFVSGSSRAYNKVAPTNISCDKVTDGGSCYYNCNEGFSMHGNPYIKCQRGGVWKGQEPTCEVIECKRIPLKKLNQLQVRARYPNGTRFGSVVQVTCVDPSHVTIGASMWPCNRLGVWKKPDNFQCKEVFCSKLEAPEHSEVLPEACSSSQLPLNTTCSVQCGRGFVLHNASNFTCTFDGKAFWKSSETPFCKDIKPPVVECVSEIRVEVWKIPPEGVYVNVSLSSANISDNSGTYRASIMGLPQNHKFKKGSTVLTYIAHDSSNHSGICHQTILVLEKTIRVFNCPKSQAVQINREDRKAMVQWDSPSFVYSNGTEAKHRCSLESGRLFQYGHHVVRCHAIDYPTSYCEFNINVREPTCELPNDAPLNGQLKCRGNRGHIVKSCSLDCLPGYESLPGAASYFECDWKGLWNVPFPWPDCYKIRKSLSQELTMDVDFKMNRGSCDMDQNKIFEKIIEFMRPFLQPNVDVSKESYVVNIKEWNTKCWEVGSDSETKRRRRRSTEDEEGSISESNETIYQEIDSVVNNRISTIKPLVQLGNLNNSLMFEKEVLMNDSTSPNQFSTYYTNLFDWIKDLTHSLLEPTNVKDLNEQKSTDKLVQPTTTTTTIWTTTAAISVTTTTPTSTTITATTTTTITTRTNALITTLTTTLATHPTTTTTFITTTIATTTVTTTTVTTTTVATTTVATTTMTTTTEMGRSIAQIASTITINRSLSTETTEKSADEIFLSTGFMDENLTSKATFLQSSNKTNASELFNETVFHNSTSSGYDATDYYESTEDSWQILATNNSTYGSEVLKVVASESEITFIIVVEIKYLDKTMYITTKEMEENAERLMENLYGLEWFDEEWSIDDTPIHMTTKLIDIQKNLMEINCSAGEQKIISSCYLCVQGTYLNSSSMMCDWCPESSYQDVPGSFDCIPCLPETITTHTKARTKRDCVAVCPLGYISTTGREPCEPCSEGYFQNQTGQRECFPCPSGFSTHSNASVDSSSCIEICESNHISSSGLHPCSDCPIGFYQPEPSQKSCLECPASPEETELVSSYCPKTVECDDHGVSCSGRGSCLQWLGHVRCSCDEGYQGKGCEEEVDECLGVVCENNGKCLDQHASFKCNCPPQFTGKLCEADVDECLREGICMHGGTCINHHGGHQCLCQDGYAGVDCSVDVDDCVSVECGGGSCVDGVNSFSCHCPPGLTGVLCDISIDICTLEPCENSGVCVANGSSRSCLCPINFTGLDCETEVGYCSTNPCGPNATCLSSTTGPQCICPLGFTGSHCTQETSPYFDLLFLPHLHSGYALVPVWKSMRELSACVWMRSNDMQNYGTIWSFKPVQEDASTFMLYDYGNLKLKMGKDKVTTGVSLNNGYWHDICVTWKSLEGLWWVYVNGSVVRNGTGMHENGVLEEGFLILGQDLENKVSKRKSFVGEMSNLALYDEWKNETFFEGFYQSDDQCPARDGSVVSWTAVVGGLKGNVLIRNSSLCRSAHQCFSSVECAPDSICTADNGVMSCKACIKDLWSVEIKCHQREVGCTSSPCQNAGVCEPRELNRGSYGCTCMQGFYGTMCEHKEDYTVCNIGLCLNGVCKEAAVNKVECRCHAGWMGRRCQTPFTSPCTNDSCPGHNTCLPTSNITFICVPPTPIWAEPIFQIIFSVVFTATILLIICVISIFCCLKKMKKSNVNRPSNDIPLRATNPCYPDISFFTQSTDTLQESYYCEPREIMPYATSEDSEKESDIEDSGSSHTRGRYNKGWTSRQNIPLPEEPEDESSSFRDFCKLNRGFRDTPPPPYYPSREQFSKHNSMQKISIPSTSNEESKHDYENDGYEKCRVSPLNCYFIPLSDEEATNKKESIDTEAYLVPSTESLADQGKLEDDENGHPDKLKQTSDK